MAHFSLQTPVGQFEHDGRNAQSLGSQRSYLDDTETRIWINESANASSGSTNILSIPTGRLEDYFVLDSHVLGSGQFGTVRRCTERASGSRFACKTLLKEGLKTEAERDEIRKEINLMQRVAVGGAHAGVVQLRAVFEDDVAVHLVMELCEGGELFDEVVRLADFGLGVALEAGERTKGVAGSPFYIAPEVLTGDYSLGADVWSLGVILYILLSGVPPFWGATDKDVFVEVLRGVVDMSGAEWEGVSEEAKHLVRCLLQSDASRRPSAAAILSHPWILRACRVSSAGARQLAPVTKSEAADTIMA
ncbi:unnamed protein product [Closterium sp. NIES-64]|nr:unnamed protein product [Closterium sp. NIES-64]